MADIHQTISLGIGSPSDIPHFILFGLSVAPVADVDAVDPTRIWLVDTRTSTWNVDEREGTWTTPTRTHTWTVD
jgi:hypothetical protein